MRNFNCKYACLTHTTLANSCSDWKKLTFYFYSTEYINFNLLVGDLFKIYKTRIWLSAINPAAFRSKPNQPPSSIGPGAVQPGSSPRTMNPHASSFYAPRNGNQLYQDDATGAVPPSSFHDNTANLGQMSGPPGVSNSFGRQQYYGATGYTDQWYAPVAPYSQQPFDLPYGNTPSPANELPFRPAPGFGQSMLRNNTRQTRTGNFGPMR